MCCMNQYNTTNLLGIITQSKSSSERITKKKVDISLLVSNLISLVSMGFLRIRYIFNLPGVFTWPPNCGVRQIYGWGLHAICHDHDESCDHKHWDSGDTFYFSRDPSWTHIQKVIWIYEKPLTLSHYLVMFGSHWSTAIGDIKHLMSCDLIKARDWGIS